MSKDQDKPGSGDEKPARKKKYRRPEILYREPLEAAAALCQPRPPAKGNVGACPMAQRS